MKTFKALLWKEFQTLKYVWLAGILLFYGIGFWPGFVESGAFGARPSQSVGGISLCFGAVYCVILAISLVCQDFQRPLENFWRARPLPVFRVILVKYALGLITLLFFAFVPLALALTFEDLQARGGDPFKLLYPSDFEVHILFYHTFTLMLVFSLCFLMAALARKPVETALLSKAAILIVYFFPVVFPPLEGLSVINLINTWDDSVGLFKPGILEIDSSHSDFATFDHHFALGSVVLAFDRAWWIFVVATIGLSTVAVTGAYRVLQRDWSFSLNQKSLAWSLAGVSLLLFGAASFEVGTNLECERVIKSPREVTIHGIVQEGGRGTLIYQTKNQDSIHLGFQQFDLNQVEVLGRSIEDPWTIGSRWVQYGDITYSWDPKSPRKIHYVARNIEFKKENLPASVNYSSPAMQAMGSDFSYTQKIGETSWTNPTRVGLPRDHLALATVDFDIPESATPISRIDLKPLMVQDLDSFIEPHFIPGLARVENHSLIANLSLDRYLYRFDLHSEGLPRAGGMITEEYDGLGYHSDARGEIESITLPLPRIPELPPRERLNVWSELQSPRARALNGELLAERNQFDRVQVFELESIDEDQAIFIKRSEIGKSPIEQLLHYGAWDLRLFENYLAVIHSGGLTLYDVSDPSRPVQVGHYNSGFDHLVTVAPLDEGRILAAGNHLHVIRLPERERS